MSAVQSLKGYVHRFLGLGWARVLLVVGVVFSLLALASPLWSVTLDHGGGDTTSTTFGWTTVTAVTYQNGVWTDTLTQSYASPNFRAPSLASAMGSSYLVSVVFLIVLLGVIVLDSLKVTQGLPSLGLLIVGLVVVIFAFAALLFPVFTAPPAAALDLGNGAITGYWGSTNVTPGTTFSWGAGLGWWFTLLAMIFGVLGGIWPFLKSMRQPMVRPPPPREWQVER